MRDTRYTLLFAVLLLAGGALRFAGLTRGSADLALPEQRPAASATPFYHFHPDEELVIRAALSRNFDLLNPPFTVYGVLPVYLLRGALETAAWARGWKALSLDEPDSARRVYYTARTLAALFSCGVLCLVWALGCRYFSRPAAGMALALVAFAPGAIQQAHFFIVDGLFVLLSTAALYASLRALESGRRQGYAIAGGLVGLTAAVRLNGLLLGLVLLAGHLGRGGREGSGWKRLSQRLRRPELWLAGGMALLALLLIEPFLLTDQELLWRTDEKEDFSHALKITRGQILQPWTLVDVHTIPYLDHWRLWPLIAGWPCTVIFSLAIAYILWKERDLPRVLMLAWCGLYFLLIGQLQARAVRYLMPMLQFLALFAGALLARAWQAPWPWVRRAGRIAAVLAVVHIGVRGVAFSRLYLEEDSRIQAGRWLARRVPPGSRIGVEGGGFPMQGLVSDQTYQHVLLDATRVFYTTPYLSCRAQLDYLGERLQNMDYFPVVDVNRYAQFTAVPELFPMVAGLYQRLAQGQLGFEQVERFKQYPHLLGMVFGDDGAEPSFLGYDHPAVWIFKSRGKEAVAEALARWKAQLEEEPCCPDRQLRQVAEAMRAGEYLQAKQAIQALSPAWPDLALGHRLLVEVHRRLGETDSAAAALVRYRLPGWSSAPSAIKADSVAAVLSRYRPENPRVAHVAHLGTVHSIPASTALSFFHLGLGELALQVLREGVAERPALSHQAAEQMAQTYLEVAKRFFEAGDLAHMEEAVELSTRIFGIKEAYNILATRAQQRGEPGQALQRWEQSLSLDPDQAEIHRRAGLVALVDLGQPDKARYHFARAIQLDPSLEAQITAELRRSPLAP